MGCEAESWSPEVISLYGDQETVLGKLGNYDMDLPNRRIYIFVAETPQQSEVAFFEKKDPKTVAISRWRGKTRPELHDRIADAITRNKGVYCVGEQTRAILAELGRPEQVDDATIPANGRAAFSRSLRAMPGDYIRSTFYLMC